MLTCRVYPDNIQKMTDFHKIEGFEWDEGNARKNEKHGVSQAEAEQVFINEPLLVLLDKKHSLGETRFHALGKTNAERLLHVSFTLRYEAGKGARIRVISARSMHVKERRIYEQKAETST